MEGQRRAVDENPTTAGLSTRRSSEEGVRLSAWQAATVFFSKMPLVRYFDNLNPEITHAFRLEQRYHLSLQRASARLSPSLLNCLKCRHTSEGSVLKLVGYHLFSWDVRGECRQFELSHECQSLLSLQAVIRCLLTAALVWTPTVGCRWEGACKWAVLPVRMCHR